MQALIANRISAIEQGPAECLDRCNVSNGYGLLCFPQSKPPAAFGIAG